MQVQHSDEELVRKINRRLMPELRQCALLLEFAEPVMLPLLQDLTLVRLYREQEQNGEEQRYMLRVTDPAYHKRIQCHVCNGPVMLVKSDTVYTCKDKRCAMHGVKIAKLRHQGITAVRWHRQFVHHWETIEYATPVDTGVLIDVRANETHTVRKQVPFLNRCIATLDRRYDATTLAAAYRTVGALADQKGWKLATPAGG